MAVLTLCAPFVPSTDLLADPSALRARAQADGYLYLPGLLPAKAVNRLRAAVLQAAGDAGWCDGAGLAAPGVVPAVEGDQAFMAVYDQIQRLEAFHALALHPALLGLYRLLFEEEVLAHPRNICRVMFPRNNPYATPPHQDFLHVRGARDTWTAWVPLGDCPLALGGLAIMAGSHREPLLPTQTALGAGGAAVDTAALPYPWVEGDMALGDVLTFHSHTVHQALPNLTPCRMRLSADFRYQPVTQPVVAASLEPHYGRLSWEEIYAGWSSRADAYYWRRLPLQVQ